MYEGLGKGVQKGNMCSKTSFRGRRKSKLLKPDFWRPIIDKLNGTVVECNTAYEGSRNTTEKTFKDY